MPAPFSTMLLQSANAFENTIADDTYRQIRDEFQKSVYGPCQSLASNRYPMDHGARGEIGLADFGRLFGGNGYFDGFFKKYLETYADTSQREWKWRQDNPVGQADVGRDIAAVSAGKQDQGRLLPDQRQRPLDQPQHHPAGAP